MFNTLWNVDRSQGSFHLHDRVVVAEPLAGIIQAIADEGGVFIFNLAAVVDMTADRVPHGVLQCQFAVLPAHRRSLVREGTVTSMKRLILLGVALIAAVLVLVVADPFGRPTEPGPGERGVEPDENVTVEAERSR